MTIATFVPTVGDKMTRLLAAITCPSRKMRQAFVLVASIIERARTR